MPVPSSIYPAPLFSSLIFMALVNFAKFVTPVRKMPPNDGVNCVDATLEQQRLKQVFDRANSRSLPRAPSWARLKLLPLLSITSANGSFAPGEMSLERPSRLAMASILANFSPRVFL